jgi:hypothetical protein
MKYLDGKKEFDCKPEYLACDISGEDMDFLNRFFSIKKINGSAKKIDLIKDNVFSLTKGFDICFLFKALDTLEAAKKNISREIIKNISSDFIVVSFATKSIGGKKSIRKERRSWFEKIVKKNGGECFVFEIENEIFYIVKK